MMEEESGHPFEEESCRSSTVRRDLREKDHSSRKVLGRLENGKERDASGASGGEGWVNRWQRRGAAKRG